MLLTTLGATGMGSILKMVGGFAAGISDAKAAAAKRELARDLAMSNASIETQKAIFGEANEETSMFTRATRRIIALIGMLNFFVISVLCTIFPGVTIITFTPQRIKKHSQSSGVSSSSPVEPTSLLRSQRGTSLWSQSPLWEQL